ncbi:MAG: hypothetical protein M0Z41_18690 [Peptococcaceae bacterium]|jgi:hypothetical protein|nr:hypothetical protein [Peptococcaceae bacterium]
MYKKFLHIGSFTISRSRHSFQFTIKFYAEEFIYFSPGKRHEPVSAKINWTLRLPCAMMKGREEAGILRISENLDVQYSGGIVSVSDREGMVVTFSKDQSIQRKVSMVLLGEFSDLPKIQVAQAFGFSARQSYYNIRELVLHGTAMDLAPKKTGPSKPPKRTHELETLIIKMRFETDRNMYEIASELSRQGFVVSPRLVADVLADYGLSKKNY